MTDIIVLLMPAWLPLVFVVWFWHKAKYYHFSFVVK